MLTFISILNVTAFCFLIYLERSKFVLTNIRLHFTIMSAIVYISSLFVEFTNYMNPVTHLIYLLYILTFFCFYSLGSKIRLPNYITPPIHSGLKYKKIVIVTYFFVCVVFLYLITNGSIQSLFNSEFTNQLKWARLTDPNITVTIMEGLYNSLLIITLSVVFSYKSNQRNLIFTFVFLMYLLYFLSTGSRSPIIGFFLTLLPIIVYSNNISLRTKKILMVLFILLILMLFALVTLSRAKLEVIKFNDIYPIFIVERFLLDDMLSLLGNGLELIIGTIIIYFASTFNNLNIIVNSYGYYDVFPGIRTLYPFLYTVKEIGIFTNEINTALDGVDDVRYILRAESPTGDQWSGSIGHAILDFGPYSLLFWSFQSLLVGILVNSVRHANNEFRTLLISVMLPNVVFAVLVHPLNSLQTYIVLFTYIAYVSLCKVRFK